MHLVKSEWPSLENINLSITVARMQISTTSATKERSIWLEPTGLTSSSQTFVRYLHKQGYNNIEAEGMYYLAKCRWPKLQTLMLNRNNIGYVKGKYSDLGCFYLSQMNVQLKELELVGNSLSTQGVLIVLYSKMIGMDSTVILRNNLYHDQAIIKH